MGRISALTEVTELASNDYFIVLDSSANIAKKVSVANAFGVPDNGFIASGESWTYSSYSSTNKSGVITVPSDATLKYAVGMFVKFTQSTGGTKWGQIIAVSSTTITVHLGTFTLNNEAITSTFYSTAYTPYGVKTRVNNPYCFSAYQSSAQSITSGAFTKINLQTEDYDYNTNFDASTNYNYTAPVAGVYRFSGRTQSSSGSASQILTMLYKNGTEVKRGNQITGVAGFHGSVVTSEVLLAAGDTVDFRCYITGVTANLASGASETYFNGSLIHQLPV